MALVTQDHFGGNLILTKDSLAEGSPLLQVLEETGITNLRYPGGTVTETQTWANGGLDRIFGAPMDPADDDYVLTLREVLAYASETGTSVTIVVPSSAMASGHSPQITIPTRIAQRITE